MPALHGLFGLLLLPGEQPVRLFLLLCFALPPPLIISCVLITHVDCFLTFGIPFLTPHLKTCVKALRN